MEEYVVPEFYDVLVGGDGSGTQDSGGESEMSGKTTIMWDLENGITGTGRWSWNYPVPDTDPWQIATATVIDHSSNAAVKASLEQYRDFFAFAPSGCKKQ